MRLNQILFISFASKLHWIHFYIIPTYTVFNDVQSTLLFSPPVSFGKSWSLAISLKKKFILKIFKLEITSRTIFLIFIFIIYDTSIIKKSSSYFFSKFTSSVCFCKLLIKLTRAVSTRLLLLHWSSKSIAFS